VLPTDVATVQSAFDVLDGQGRSLSPNLIEAKARLGAALEAYTLTVPPKKAADSTEETAEDRFKRLLNRK
jgi:hypothetical protein